MDASPILFSLLLALTTSACIKAQKTDRKADADLPQSGDAEALTFHRHIRPLMETKCAGCHSTGGLSGLNLTSYAQVKALRNSIRSAVIEKRMPPWLAENGHQLYRDDLSLLPVEINRLVAWIDQDAPEGSPSDYVPPVAKTVFTPDARVPIFADGGAFLPEQSMADEYRCFVIPFGDKLGDKSFITGFTATAGNKKIAHHLVAYMATADILPVLQELDADEAGRGYRCFAGALPDRFGDPSVRNALETKYPGITTKLNNENYWLAHWAPGMDGGYTFPKGTGIKVPRNGAFVIQMHYYTAEAKGETDQDTVFAVQLASAVEKPAFYFPLTNNSWLNSRANKSMVIPAKGTATFSTQATLANIALYGERVLGVPNSAVKNLEVHSANLHMHAIGASGTITLGSLRSGQEETLLNVPEWDLHWQRDFQLDEPKIIAPDQWGDLVNRVSCTYSNDRDDEAFGGFGSLDEMCFNFGFFAFDLGGTDTWPTTRGTRSY